MWCNADLLCNYWIKPHMLCWRIWSLWITEAVDVWVKYFYIYLHNNQISTNHQAIQKCCLLCNNFLSFSRWDLHCIRVCPMNMDMVIVYFVWDILLVPRGFGKIGSVLWTAAFEITIKLKRNLYIRHIDIFPNFWWCLPILKVALLVAWLSHCKWSTPVAPFTNMV